MQNQKTAPREDSELKPLSKREQALVEAIAAGDNNTEAYRKAYGPGSYSQPALMVAACRKVAEAHIQEHLRQLRAVGLAKVQLSLDERIVDELAFAQRCEDAGNMGAAGGARDRVNKLLGLYVERTEVQVTDTSAIMRDLEELLGADKAQELDQLA